MEAEPDRPNRRPTRDHRPAVCEALSRSMELSSVSDVALPSGAGASLLCHPCSASFLDFWPGALRVLSPAQCSLWASRVRLPRKGALTRGEPFRERPGKRALPRQHAAWLNTTMPFLHRS